jgi:nucleoside-diphosphate-sugar epimerase
MEDTGWRPEIPIKTTLADMLAYWRALQSKLAVQRGSGC